MIDLNGLPVKEYIRLGLLEDLTPLFASDPDIDIDDILKAPLEASLNDGKLYYSMGGFKVDMLFSQIGCSEREEGWTVKEMIDYFDSCPQDAVLLPSRDGGALFSSIVEHSMDDHIDWEKGTVSFDDDEFKALLEKVKSMDSDRSEENDSETIPELIRENKLCTQIVVGGLADYIAEIKMFGKNMKTIGYPNKARKGSTFILEEQYGISTKSDNKDHSWAFLKAVMSKEHQYNMFTESVITIPSRNDCYLMYVRSMKETQEYTDDMGNQYVPEKYSYSFAGEDEDYTLGDITDEDMRDFEGLLNRTDMVLEHNTEIMDIINAEAQKYFSDLQSVDETIEKIQKRISIYVAERK